MTYALANDSPLAGDPAVYQQRLLAITGGGTPYIDPVFEHLPGAAIPMIIAGTWAGLSPDRKFHFVLAFALLMSLCLAAVGELLLRSRPEGPRRARRWLLLSTPLLPLVVFRNDPWVVLLAVGALTMTSGRLRASFAVLGVLSKGWPVILAPIAWRHGRRGLAVGITVAGVIALGLMLSPGFVATQAASGLHAETLVGSIFGLIRVADGADPLVTVTTAAYVDVPRWASIVGPALAVIPLWVGMVEALRGEQGAEHRAVLLLVLGVVLSSRVFSAQYALWLTPFVAMSGDRWLGRLMLLVNIQCVIAVATFNDLLARDPIWWIGAFGRNLLILIMVIATVLQITSGKPARTSSSTSSLCAQRACRTAVSRLPGHEE